MILAVFDDLFFSIKIKNAAKLLGAERRADARLRLARARHNRWGSHGIRAIVDDPD